MPSLPLWTLRVLSLLFGGVFVYAGWLKVQDPGLFAVAVRSFDMVPDPYAAWLALTLPWLEIFAGLAVITGVLRQSGLLLLNLSLVAFFIALGYAWHRGLNIECGCFGGASGKQPDYTWLFARDGVLLACGLFLMWLQHRHERATAATDSIP